MGSRGRRVDVVGFGANSVDYVAVLPATPGTAPDRSKMRIETHVVSGGGQVLTTMATCASLGLSSRYLGVVGTDPNGRRILDEMRARGIDTSGVVERSGENQFAFILLDRTTGERIVLWNRDEALSVPPLELPAEALSSARLLHVDDVDQESAIRAASAATALGLPVTSDIDRITDRTEALVRAVTVPIFAEAVPPALTGEADPERALRRLRRIHSGVLVVTLGERGALALDGDRLFHSPAFTVRVADTTGSGDVFRGGFIYGWLRKWPLEQTLRFANAAAAVSCTRLGALNGVPTPGETESLLRGVPQASS